MRRSCRILTLARAYSWHTLALMLPLPGYVGAHIEREIRSLSPASFQIGIGSRAAGNAAAQARHSHAG